jgi:transposase
LTFIPNAALSLNQRRRLARRIVEERWLLAEAAKAAEVSERTARKWADRYLAEGEAGLRHRSSAPREVHNRTDERRVRVIAALRHLRFSGPEIAEVLEMASSTVSAILGRIGLGKLSRLEPLEPVRRHEKRRAGELVHLDVKKLGRISVKGAAAPARRRRQQLITARRMSVEMPPASPPNAAPEPPRSRRRRRAGPRKPSPA